MLKLFLRTSRWGLFTSPKVSDLAIVALQNKTAKRESEGIYELHRCEISLTA
jgi:hypothetical protein